MSKWVVDLVAVVIIVAWVVSLVASILVPGYKPPESVNWCMTVLAGAAFGKLALQSIAGSDKNGKQQ